tara:strand:+ start:89 stop:1417 length:1329 start_codon:yes stop_codon:yes gene_type:complete
MNNKKYPLFILFLVVLIDMIGFTLVIPFLTYFIQDLAEKAGTVGVGNRDWWVGITLAAYTFGQFLFTPVISTMSDKFGRRPIIIFGLISNTIFLFAFGLSGSLWFALIVRFLAGVGNANIAVSRAYIGDVSEPEKLAARMGLLGAAFGLGFMVGPFLGGVLSNPADVIGGIFDNNFWREYPYLLPCIFASLLSGISLILAIFKLPESLPKESRTGAADSPIKSIKKIFNSLVGIKNLEPSLSLLILINAIYLLSFTMMHATFILFTGMEISKGGLDYSPTMNGYLFAYVGLNGVIIQGGLIRVLSKKFDNKLLMLSGLIISAIGLVSIPYLNPEPFLIILFILTLVSLGSGLFQPTQSALLTLEARDSNVELGFVMGSQEGFGALSRVLGPIIAAFIWKATVENDGYFDYHTVFHVCGILMLFAVLMQLKLKLNYQDKIVEN